MNQYSGTYRSRISQMHLSPIFWSLSLKYIENFEPSICDAVGKLA